MSATAAERGAISLRLEKELLEQLRAVAKKNERTVSQQVRQYVKDGLERAA